MADDAPRADSFVLEIPEMVGIALAAQRSAQQPRRVWPAGTRIISADSHMLETDCWIDFFPDDLKDQAPRMTFADGAYQLSIGEKQMTPIPVSCVALKTSSFSGSCCNMLKRG